jgi:FtsP/CotA-like multicopper oxidase with cupredoxin domain
MMGTFHVHGIPPGGGERPRPAAGKQRLEGYRPSERGRTPRPLGTPPSGEPFMIHCHILEHEDAGMMAQFAAA